MTTPTSPPATVPKAVLYTNPSHFWCASVFLALEEKGYAPDELEIKIVDVAKGENFTPSFMRLSKEGKVPCLVVPLEKTLSRDVESRYKAIIKPKQIVEFLDKSRTAISKRNTTSTAPAPALAPATISGSTLSNAIIELIESQAVHPDFLLISALSPTELTSKSSSFPGAWLRARQTALTSHLDSGTPDEPVPEKLRKVIEEKIAYNGEWVAVYDGSAEESVREAFFERSRESWEVNLPMALATLEESIVGPYCLGDQLSLADLHLAPWLARLVLLSGGDASAEGIVKLKVKIEGKGVVGEKVRGFWVEMVGRKSFKKVYGNGLF